MSVHLISADEAMARYDRFDAVVDARSEGEHAEDHLPGALNWPSLDNEERIRVGTLYKQVSPFEAQKIGAALVAANISRHIQAHVLDKPKSWQPLIYCWRGGKRSNSLALILGQIGFKVHLIEGGYKAFRKAVVEDTPRRVAPLQFCVLCGPGCAGARSGSHRQPPRLGAGRDPGPAPAHAKSFRDAAVGRIAPPQPCPPGIRRGRKQEGRQPDHSGQPDGGHARQPLCPAGIVSGRPRAAVDGGL
jgi:tRNA 2-selenouridine synthase